MNRRTRRSRAGVIGVVWRVLRDARRPGGAGLRERLASLPRLARSTMTGRYGGMGRGRLLGMVLAAIYVVSPVDLVPEAFLGPLGLADDLGVAAWLAGALLVETDRYLEWESTRPTVVPGSVIR